MKYFLTLLGALLLSVSLNAQEKLSDADLQKEVQTYFGEIQKRFPMGPTGSEIDNVAKEIDGFISKAENPTGQLAIQLYMVKGMLFDQGLRTEDALPEYAKAYEIAEGQMKSQILAHYAGAAAKVGDKELLASLQKAAEATGDEQLLSMIKGQILQAKLSAGNKFPELSFTDMDGKKVDLSAMNGKVVLIDFWATWCGPCIAEMPHVIKAYEEYHDKGFEVIGISLDQSEDDLRKFIKENNMPWPQAFDGKGWQSEIAQKFGISSIPATYLVGTDGVIIANNLRGDALEKHLKEHLAK